MAIVVFAGMFVSRASPLWINSLSYRLSSDYIINLVDLIPPIDPCIKR